MTRRGVILLAFVIMSLVVGFMAGYRFRISQEEVFYPDPNFKLPVPERLSEYDGEGWAYAWQRPSFS